MIKTDVDRLLDESLRDFERKYTDTSKKIISDASNKDFERWFASEFPWRTADREFAFTVWQAAVAFMENKG